MSVMAVANRIPNPSDTAIGTRNLAWMSVSNSMGVKPAKVVSEVNRMGRNRAAPASVAALTKSSPLARCRFT